MKTQFYQSPRYYLNRIQSVDKFTNPNQLLSLPSSNFSPPKHQNNVIPLSYYSSLEKKQQKVVTQNQCSSLLKNCKLKTLESPKKICEQVFSSFLEKTKKYSIALTMKGEDQVRNKQIFSKRKISIQTSDAQHKLNRSALKCSPKMALKNNPEIHPQIEAVKNYTQSVSTESSSKKMRKTLKLADFEIGKKIGTGKYGEVFIAKHKNSGSVYALKKIEKLDLSEEMKNQLINEIKIQSYLDHPNVVKLYAFFADQEYIYLVMELCTSGHLYDFVKNKNVLKEDDCKIIVKQLCQGVDYLHQNQILHRDLKLQNILYHFGMIKICDFGWSTISQGMRQTFCGTPLYFSPQLLQQKYYSHKVDVWSIGVLTFEIIYGRPPFQITCQNDFSKIVEDEIVFPKFPAISQISKDFLKKCLRKNPEQRMEVLELISHKYLQNCESINCSHLY